MTIPAGADIPSRPGMLPGIAYYLSRWYTKDELAFRLALYIGK